MLRFLIILILALLAVAYFIGSRGERERVIGASQVNVSEGSRITQNTWGCRTEEQLQGIAQVRAQGDSAATAAALGRQINAGNCITLDTGDRVSITDNHLAAFLTQVRKEGQTDSYWIALEAVQ